MEKFSYETKFAKLREREREREEGRSVTESVKNQGGGEDEGTRRGKNRIRGKDKEEDLVKRPRETRRKQALSEDISRNLEGRKIYFSKNQPTQHREGGTAEGSAGRKLKTNKASDN